MKFTTALLFLTPTLISGFRDQTQKKSDHRRLEENMVCTVDHSTARSVTEQTVSVQAFPDDAHGLFDITLYGPPYAPEGGHVTVAGWCIDYDREIWTADFSMDIFSAFDPELPLDDKLMSFDEEYWVGRGRRRRKNTRTIEGNRKAVDYPERLPNLAWMINNVNVGDVVEPFDGCRGGTITWFELQGAVWKLIDDNDGADHWFYGNIDNGEDEYGRIECVAEYIKDRALAEGNGYEPDCMDPHEQIPLVFISDKDEDGQILNQVIMSETNIHTVKNMCQCEVVEEPELRAAPPKNKGSGSGDPHFKTWTGEKYDYHGECDLVLVDNPTFMDGLGLKIHIRTTRVKYFSYIEKVAVQIGEDVLEFDNNVEHFFINGNLAETNVKHHKTLLGGFVVRRDTKALSIRLHDNGSEDRLAGMVAKIDLHTRKNGFPAVIVDGGKTDVFRGSLGLLGEWESGKKMARDGQTEIEDPTEFALEWQVRDTEPMLFKESRFPQFPQVCIPPGDKPVRLGMENARKEAEEACAHWEEDQDDCIFDVIATRDVLVAEEGHIVHVE